MNNLFYSLLILIMTPTISIADSIIDCHYDGDDFYVYTDTRDFRHMADDDYQNALIECRRNIAVLYDGDDLIVFSGKNNQFYRHMADDNYSKALLRVSRDLVAFYDGDDFIVFDNNRKSFSRHMADDSFEKAQLVRFRKGAALYDGDDLIVYNKERNFFQRHFANDNYQHSKILSSPHGLLFYDGDDIISYCDGSFRRISADDNIIPRISGRNPRVNRVLRLNDKAYILMTDCKIRVLRSEEI